VDGFDCQNYLVREYSITSDWVLGVFGEEVIKVEVIEWTSQSWKPGHITITIDLNHLWSQLIIRNIKDCWWSR